MSGSAHSSCSQQVSALAIFCQKSRHMQRICSCLSCCAGHFQNCTILADLFSADTGVGVFYVNLTLASWIKFNSVTIAAAIMTAVFGVGFVYFLYIHARWWGPVVKSVSRAYGPSLKVGALLLACHDTDRPSAKYCIAIHSEQRAGCACAGSEGSHVTIP